MQAGINSTPWRLQGTAQDLLLRCLVLRTYLPSDPDHPAGRPVLMNIGPPVAGRAATGQVQLTYKASEINQVLCDLLPYGETYRGPIMPLVPVALRRGRSDVWGSWIPRGAIWSAAGGVGVASSRVAVAVAHGLTNPKDLDCDQVLVGFMDGDENLPIILHGLQHAWAEEDLPVWRATVGGNYPAVGDQGPASSYCVRHRGTTLRVDSDGSLTIDATQHGTGTYDDKGAELAPYGPGGAITIHAANDRTIRAEGGKVELVAGAGPVNRKVARTDDATHGTLSIVPGTQNPELAQFITDVGIALGIVPVANEALAAGIDTAITEGHDNVLMDT